MNIKYDFTQPGGFPFDQDVLNDLQNAMVEAELAMSAIVGPLAIISGCLVVAGVAANGIVAINGVLMPFVGGAVSANVVVVQSPSALTYQNGSQPNSKITQYATFSDDGPLVWADFVTLTTEGVVADIDGLNTDVATLGADITNIEANYLQILAKGTLHLGDIDPVTEGEGVTFTIEFPTALSTADYMVLMELSINSGTTTQNDIDEPVIVTKTMEGFSFCVHEASEETQDLNFTYIVVAM